MAQPKTRLQDLHIDPPLLNSSCPWASSKEDLERLYNCPYTGALTTRTATLHGFQEDPDIHKVAFAARSTTSINSYGYSPFPLSDYIRWVQSIFPRGSSKEAKPVIFSITSSDPRELRQMIDMITSAFNDLELPIGIELNTSCPNIPNSTPPAYDPIKLMPLLEVMKDLYDQTKITMGLKLAPFLFRQQQVDMVDLIAALAKGEETNPIAFLTCTNTLGGCAMFQHQTTGKAIEEEGKIVDEGREELARMALPTNTGGVGGDAIHYLSLGNVITFKEILSSHPSSSIRDIKIIGVGGVTSPEAYRRMRLAGADYVACATALGKEGVGVFARLLQGGNA